VYMVSCRQGVQRGGEVGAAYKIGNNMLLPPPPPLLLLLLLLLAPWPMCQCPGVSLQATAAGCCSPCSEG
jgi:hypothetical protein